MVETLKLPIKDDDVVNIERFFNICRCELLVFWRIGEILGGRLFDYFIQISKRQPKFAFFIKFINKNNSFSKYRINFAKMTNQDCVFGVVHPKNWAYDGKYPIQIIQIGCRL